MGDLVPDATADAMADPMADLAVGLDIGGTKSSAALVDREGRVHRSVSAPTPGADGAEAVLATAAGLVRSLTDAGERVVGLGVGTAGVVAPGSGRIVSATDVLRGWAGTDVGAGLTDRTGIGRVVVDNDVHAHALGETWRGAATDATSVLFVAAGTGIGASVVVDGRVWHGVRGVAGHLGHLPSPEASGILCVCGGSGHVEAIAAGPAIVRHHDAHAAEPAGDLRTLARRAAGGDTGAAASIDLGARALGRVVGGAANLLDPDAVVVGGGVVGAGALWWAALEDALRAELLPPLRDLSVRPALLAADAALVGAARLVWEDLA
ncbi:ROK family protein [Intrasporangium flavum]|uniref:ROK family protein n=1 Tax=Intrasporangium flavum TaxID=1428657 RepID=UPI001F600C7C|nr:ROK family protein [Intrasporangium flavum]